MILRSTIEENIVGMFSLLYGTTLEIEKLICKHKESPFPARYVGLSFAKKGPFTV